MAPRKATFTSWGPNPTQKLVAWIQLIDLNDGANVIWQFADGEEEKQSMGEGSEIHLDTSTSSFTWDTTGWDATSSYNSTKTC